MEFEHVKTTNPDNKSRIRENRRSNKMSSNQINPDFEETACICRNSNCIRNPKELAVRRFTTMNHYRMSNNI